MDSSLSLLSKTTVSTAVKGKTHLYTVPPGYNCVLSHAFFISAGDQATSRISIGQTSDLDDWLKDRILSEVDASGDIALLMPRAVKAVGEDQRQEQIGTQVLYTEGEHIWFDCKTWEGIAANTLILIGVLYE